jgi:aldehyde dehydrogenase (NAD+)
MAAMTADSPALPCSNALAPLLRELHVALPAATAAPGTAGALSVRSPIDGSTLASLPMHGPADIAAAIARAQSAFLSWRTVPAPRRGELVRCFGEQLRRHKAALGALVTLETGKIASESAGEVQEMIDICDFALGLSRQLHGLTLPSERPQHRMMEQWHPLGVVGVISAFNFPVAVWAWNAALALVCGNALVWKPSEKTPLSALAAQALFEQAARDSGIDVPPHLSQVIIGSATAGEALVDDAGIALLSATGSTRMGRAVAPGVAQRFGRSLLELGGNNAVVVAPSADLDLAVRGIAFGAWGTAGQRCTTTRRVIAHASVHDALVDRLERVRTQLPAGDPRADGVLVGPLIDEQAFAQMQQALEAARAEGGQVAGGERIVVAGCNDGWYARPALAQMPAQTAIVCRETFAPILYTLRYESLHEAIALQNAVPQGLSAAIFTRDLSEAERFMAADGADCGIVNVNIGTSGAEIGGAFGGEKETGGGRESGSDAWKAYMRRATNTINYGDALPLAQGVRFDV